MSIKYVCIECTDKFGRNSVNRTAAKQHLFDIKSANVIRYFHWLAKKSLCLKAETGQMPVSAFS